LFISDSDFLCCCLATLLLENLIDDSNGRAFDAIFNSFRFDMGTKLDVVIGLTHVGDGV
jgi:hypothetical protein